MAVGGPRPGSSSLRLRVGWGIVAAVVAVLATSGRGHAQPLITFDPTTPVTIEVVPGTSAIVEYLVSNQAASPESGSMVAIDGVTQVTTGSGVCPHPFDLTAKNQPGSSCLLRLEIDADGIAPSGISGGPVVCLEPLQCYQPSAGDALNVTIASVPCTGDGECPSEQYCRVDECAAQKPLGSSCAGGNQCSSGYCVDGVCCDSECAGGASDCQACSLAAGASSDGTCAPLADGAACDDGDGCTLEETCTLGACSGGNAACDELTPCTSTDGASFVCEPCPAGTYSDGGTGATDCLPCDEGTFASAPGSVQCTALTDCGDGQVEVSAGTATTDRVCGPAGGGSEPDAGPEVDGGLPPSGADGESGGDGCQISSLGGRGDPRGSVLLVLAFALALTHTLRRRGLG